MKLTQRYLLIVAYLFLFITISNNLFSQNSIYRDLSKDFYENTEIQIKNIQDLRNRTVTINNCKIEFSGDGQIENGILIGINNDLISRKKPIFNNVLIKESFINKPFYLSWWLIPSISEKDLNNKKIQEAINSIPDSSKLNFDSQYEILCDPIFRIVNKNHITIDFNKSHFYTDKSAGGKSSFFLLSNSKDMTLTNLYITGDTKYHAAKDLGEWGMGINILGCSNVLIKNSNIDQCWGDNIYISGDENFAPSQNITIKDCILTDGRRNNISVINADYVSVEGCSIFKTKNLPDQIRATGPFTGIDLEPNNLIKEKVTNFSLINTIIDMGEVGKVGLKNTQNFNGQFFKIINCRFQSMEHAFQFFKSENLIIDSCTFINITSNPIILENLSNVQIINNSFLSVPDYSKSIEDNFQLMNSSNIIMKNNILLDKN